MKKKRDPIVGVQHNLAAHFPEVAYGTENGILCDRHLDEVRKTQALKLNGITYPKDMCKFCSKETI